MPQVKIKRYLWLLRILKTWGPLSFDEINSRWKKSTLNETGDDLPKKTFHNHCEIIASLFGIEIECRRKGGYKYFINESDKPDPWLQSLLGVLCLQEEVEDDPSLRDRVVLRTSGPAPYLYEMLDIIRSRRLISFNFAVPTSTDEVTGEMSEGIALPYPGYCPLGLAHIGFTWFVIGEFFLPEECRDNHRIAVFSLDNMEDIKIMEDVHPVDYPEDFSVSKYLEEFSFSLKRDSDFADERIWLALHLGKFSE